MAVLLSVSMVACIGLVFGSMAGWFRRVRAAACGVHGGICAMCGQAVLVLFFAAAWCAWFAVVVERV